MVYAWTKADTGGSAVLLHPLKDSGGDVGFDYLMEL